MRTTTDDEMVARGGRIGQLATFFSLVMVLGGLIASFTQYRLITVFIIALGVVMYTLGARNQEQASRQPLHIKQLTEALSEFDDRYRLYNYVLPAPHVLLTPYGVFVLVLKGMDGKIRCFKDKWARDLGLRRILRFFTEEPLGNPSKEAAQDVKKLQKYVEQHAPAVQADTSGVVVFLNPGARLEIATASVPVLPVRRLKSHIRKASAQMDLPPETLDTLTQLFDKAPRS
jgi:hypothetical protein